VIVVDTSALVAIIAEEPISEACRAALRDGGKLYISGGTVAEP